jgi:hypothetical protein
MIFTSCLHSSHSFIESQAYISIYFAQISTLPIKSKRLVFWCRNELTGDAATFADESQIAQALDIGRRTTPEEYRNTSTRSIAVVVLSTQ